MDDRRVIRFEEIAETVSKLCVEANTLLPRQVCRLLDGACAAEPYAPARETLGLIRKNAEIAKAEAMPICQDTGMAVVYATVGQDAHIVGGTLEDAVNAGVARGYTGDNAPAVLHVTLAAGDRLRLTVAPKGFGSENMSRLAMLTPSHGLEGVKNFVIETARLAGANPCPPIMLGVGLGGTFERVAELAKEALIELREGPHPDPYYDDLERELTRQINLLGIGPQGFGGQTTALSVRIKAYPTHIAGLPVAVNVGCHVTRHASATL